MKKMGASLQQKNIKLALGLIYLTIIFFVLYILFSNFEYEDFSLVTEKKNKYVNMTFVKSQGEHFSIGARANYTQSTSQNYDGEYKFSPCIEYNFFPYSESSEHRFSLLYGISATYNDYTDTTIYQFLFRWIY